MRLSRLLLISLAMVIALFVGACAKQPPPTDPAERVRVYANDLANQLQSRGVQIVKAGETMLLVFPTDQLFNPASANFNTNYMDVMEKAARFIKLFETTLVKVSGFTNTEPTFLLNKALSERQAQVVVSYLWSRNIDARVVYPVGYGTHWPIVYNYTPEGRLKNQRIELFFQFEPIIWGM